MDAESVPDLQVESLGKYRPDLELTKINDLQLGHVCRYRQKGACKYIVYLLQHNGFYCGKNLPEIRAAIQNQGSMKATGDNCEGLP